ncbi:MAG: outer membrane lipoprotein-sorting protein, partial [Candidatus Goldbacteria bacterium]|nr:outer membrane lipoprotein-sorting protein [Candidatus Goldiibacteriota bacterium]
MKKFLLFLVLFFTLISVNQFLYSDDKELTGLDIIKKADAANKSKKGMVKKGLMELINLETQQKESRKFVILSLTNEEGEKSMFRFIDSSYAGTTFLSSKKEDKTVMYIYLKSIGSPRQVEGSDKEATFVDTDITNEEMSGGVTEDYEYKRLEDKKIDGIDCYVVERYPKSKSSKFSKHIVFIDKTTLKTLIMKSYSKEGRLVKT